MPAVAVRHKKEKVLTFNTIVWKKCWLSKAEASDGAQVWSVAGIQMGAGLKTSCRDFLYWEWAEGECLKMQE